MRVFVAGCKGQLGRAMMRHVRDGGHEAAGADLPELDLLDEAGTREHVGRWAPEVLINCAAYTAVDRAEEDEAAAFAVNRDAARNAALAAKDAGALFIHFSTDYVFDGAARTPYAEDAPTSPATVYGRSKAAGEEAVSEAYDRHQILRTAWLYGIDGANFVKTIIGAGRSMAKQGRPLRVVDDQRGSPTCAEDVCRQTLASMRCGEYGLFHCTSQGDCTWYEFTKHITSRCGIDVEVQPCATDEFPRPAKRPAYSVLADTRYPSMGCAVMPRWDDAFDTFCDTWRTQLLSPEEHQ